MYVRKEITDEKEAYNFKKSFKFKKISEKKFRFAEGLPQKFQILCYKITFISRRKTKNKNFSKYH